MEPSADEIRLQLDRLLASDGFANADRMSGFLRYVVERVAGGRERSAQGVRDWRRSVRARRTVRPAPRFHRPGRGAAAADQARRVLRGRAAATTRSSSGCGAAATSRTFEQSAAPLPSEPASTARQSIAPARTDAVAARARRARRRASWSRSRSAFTVWRSGLVDVGRARHADRHDRRAALRRVLERAGRRAPGRPLDRWRHERARPHPRARRRVAHERAAVCRHPPAAPRDRAGAQRGADPRRQRARGRRPACASRRAWSTRAKDRKIWVEDFVGTLTDSRA